MMSHDLLVQMAYSCRLRQLVINLPSRFPTITRLLGNVTRV